MVIGSAALKDWAWFERLAARGDMKGRVVLGLDARDGKLAAHGWTQATGKGCNGMGRQSCLPIFTRICRAAII